jgi:hypothetical protein
MDLDDTINAFMDAIDPATLPDGGFEILDGRDGNCAHAWEPCHYVRQPADMEPPYWAACRQPRDRRVGRARNHRRQPVLTPCHERTGP